MKLWYMFGYVLGTTTHPPKRILKPQPSGMAHPPINYCSHCGSKVEQIIPPGETLVRAVCVSCNTIHYQNPKIVAGCIPEWENQILLCRRAIEPRLGFWTFPAGFMEMGETMEDAAARETLEEAKADVEITSIFALYTLRRVDQVYVVFRGQLRKMEFGVGDESSEVELVSLENIPWEHLAFPVIQEILGRYAEDHQRGQFHTHLGEIPSEIFKI